MREPGGGIGSDNKSYRRQSVSPLLAMANAPTVPVMSAFGERADIAPTLLVIGARLPRLKRVRRRRWALLSRERLKAKEEQRPVQIRAFCAIIHKGGYSLPPSFPDVAPAASWRPGNRRREVSWTYLHHCADGLVRCGALPSVARACQEAVRPLAPSYQTANRWMKTCRR